MYVLFEWPQPKKMYENCAQRKIGQSYEQCVKTSCLHSCFSRYIDLAANVFCCIAMMNFLTGKWLLRSPPSECLLTETYLSFLRCIPLSLFEITTN